MTLEGMFRGDELVPGALRGYRTWEATSDGRLTSTAIRHTYGPPGTVEQAMCRRYPSGPTVDDHGDAPEAGCTCGFYGWYAPVDSRIVPGSVFGVVEATGRVVLGTHGFRAQHLKVVALTSTDARFAALVDAGFTVYGSRDELLADYPPDDMRGLIDHRCGRECRDVAPFAGAQAWALMQGVFRQTLGQMVKATAQALLEAQRAAASRAQPGPTTPSSP